MLCCWHLLFGRLAWPRAVVPGCYFGVLNARWAAGDNAVSVQERSGAG